MKAAKEEARGRHRVNLRIYFGSPRASGTFTQYIRNPENQYVVVSCFLMPISLRKQRFQDVERHGGIYGHGQA